MNSQSFKEEFIKVPLLGSSMWPLFNNGEILLIETLKGPKISQSDFGKIFIFKDSTGWICHRYLGDKDNHLLFKGDYSTATDKIQNPIILGCVVGVNKNGTNYFLKSNWSQFMAHLQKKSLSSNRYLAKGFRYLALGLSGILKPFFYRKYKPS